MSPTSTLSKQPIVRLSRLVRPTSNTTLFQMATIFGSSRLQVIIIEELAEAINRKEARTMVRDLNLYGWPKDKAAA